MLSKENSCARMRVLLRLQVKNTCKGVESDEIVANARKNGVKVEYVIFPDEGHGFVKKENNIKASEEVLKFLDANLRGVK